MRKIYMDTPVGRLPVPDGIATYYENMSADEVWEILQSEKKRTGFVDPFLMAIWADKNPAAYSVRKAICGIHGRRKR